MEEFYCKHPLDRLLHNDNIFLLEALIPYVDYELKFPLIIFIKFLEIKKLHEYFSDAEKINTYGFNNNKFDISSIANEIKNMGDFPPSSPIAQSLNLYSMYENFKKMNDMMESMGYGSMSDMMKNMNTNNQSNDSPISPNNNMLSGLMGAVSNMNPDMLSSLMGNLGNMNPDMLSNIMSIMSTTNVASPTKDDDSLTDMINAYHFDNDMPIIYEPNQADDNNIYSSNNTEFDFDKFFKDYDNKEINE